VAVSVTAFEEETLTTIPTPLFSFPLGDDAVLIPRTAAITDAYHDLLVANSERLARWEPWAGKPPVLEETRSFLESSGRNWLDGSELPVAIAVSRDGQWHLAGALSLTISRYSRSAEIGYWIGAEYEGRGLITRAVAAVLDQAFGTLGLDRVSLHTDPANKRSRAVAQRLGFVEEGILRQGTAFPDGRRDELVYGLLADEWQRRSAR
jgi:ribosomal-protein-serine acetyltransferase